MAGNANAQSFIPEIWDAHVLRTLEDNLVAKKICNLKPTAEIRGAGDTIYFNGLADPTINTYTGTVSYETLVDSQIALLINKQVYYGFDVTDPEEAMSNVGLKGSQSDRAGYVLQKAIDTDIFTNYANAGLASSATVTSATALGFFAETARKLYEQNVQDSNIWMVIPPWLRLKLKLAGIAFQIDTGISGTGGMAWTNELGFDIFVTNNLYYSGTLASPVTHCMAGSYQAIGFAEKLMKSESLRAEVAFATHIRGLAIYGHKVIKPNELVDAVATYAAETAI